MTSACSTGLCGYCTRCCFHPIATPLPPFYTSPGYEATFGGGMVKLPTSRLTTTTEDTMLPTAPGPLLPPSLALALGAHIAKKVALAVTVPHHLIYPPSSSNSNYYSCQPSFSSSRRPLALTVAFNAILPSLLTTTFS